MGQTTYRLDPVITRFLPLTVNLVICSRPGKQRGAGICWGCIISAITYLLVCIEAKISHYIVTAEATMPDLLMRVQSKRMKEGDHPLSSIISG
jgi:hypothetical protein